MKRIGPGIYEDGDEWRIDAEAFCIEQGIPPTPENQDAAIESIRKAFAKVSPTTEIEVREDLPLWRGPPV